MAAEEDEIDEICIVTMIGGRVYVPFEREHTVRDLRRTFAEYANLPSEHLIKLFCGRIKYDNLDELVVDSGILNKKRIKATVIQIPEGTCIVLSQILSKRDELSLSQIFNYEGNFYQNTIPTGIVLEITNVDGIQVECEFRLGDQVITGHFNAVNVETSNLTIKSLKYVSEEEEVKIKIFEKSFEHDLEYVKEMWNKYSFLQELKEKGTGMTLFLNACCQGFSFKRIRLI